MKTKHKALYTTPEAAEILCVHRKTVCEYIASGKLHAVRRGGGDYLIHENSLRTFLGLEPDESLLPISMEKPDVTTE